MTSGASNRAGIFGSVAPAAGGGGAALLGGWHADDALAGGGGGPFAQGSLQNILGTPTPNITLTGHSFIVQYSSRMIVQGSGTLLSLRVLGANIQIDGTPIPVTGSFSAKVYDLGPLQTGDPVIQILVGYFDTGEAFPVTFQQIVSVHDPNMIPAPPFFTPTWFVAGAHVFQMVYTVAVGVANAAGVFGGTYTVSVLDEDVTVFEDAGDILQVF